jgi:hypothetical protein
MLLDHGPGPYAVHNLVLADKLAAGLDQNDKNIESPAADRDKYPVREKLAAVRIQPKAAKLRDRRAATVTDRAPP